MPEAAQVAGLREDGKRVDRTDPGDHAQELIVTVSSQRFMGNAFDLVTLLNKGSSLSDDHTKHRDRSGVLVNRQRH